MTIDWAEIAQTPALRLSGQGREARHGDTTARDYGEGFRELSPTLPGEGYQRLHWPSLIQRGELISKRFDQPLGGALWLWLDETGSMKTGRQWTFSRQLAARLSVGSIRGGHTVIFLIEREEALTQSVPIRSMDLLLQEWSRLLGDQPSGGGATPAQCERALHLFPKGGSLVCFSDGIYTTKSEGEALVLMDSSQRFQGGVLKAQRLIYLCIVDQEAETPSNLVLTSPEDLSSQALRVDPEQGERLRLAIHQHRRLQREVLKSRRGILWLDLDVDDELERAYLQVSQQLCL